ncbi:hypothetical protein [Marinomonas sp. GJ51-6]|uniref:hypothetical protein n=1 Tax=Marinomonas sp. GJ51-6 TaxID=2992802 RepID=UPI002934168C|nr:hypothetical protein [Marinomonas sp. GJ51-6]WOD06314.1 hypothetical protein ONZ50_11300 [Marinomonas sp. GJ51-6]
MILDAFKMPPRTAIQIADRVIATLSNMPKGSKIDILMLTTLLCFNEEDSKQFQRIISDDFSYKDKNDKEKGITGYIENRFSHYKSDFEMHFNPQIDHPKFDVVQRPFRENNYPEGTYLIPFLNYLQDLCSIYTSAYDGSMIKFSLLGTSGIEGTKYQRAQAELYEKQQRRGKYDIEKPFSEGALWLETLYYQGCFYDVTLSKYADYVELASALDWIDGDTSSDNA